MADTNPFSSFFWQNDPNVNSQLRQRIAMAMLSGKKGYPKTLGEGLAAIGDALGDRGMMRQLEALDRSQREAAFGAPQAPAAPPVRSSYAPETVQPDTGASGGSSTPGLGSSAPAPETTTFNTSAELPSGSDLAYDKSGGLTAPTATLADLQPPASASSSNQQPTRSASSDMPVLDHSQYNELDQAANLRDQRSAYMKQLEANPALMLRQAALGHAEEGPGVRNAIARKMFDESAMNRYAARGYNDVNRALDPRYYQPMHDGSGSYAKNEAALRNDPALLAQRVAEIRSVGNEGTNFSNLATDNASGNVAANAMGNQTLTAQAPNQESFFRKDIRPDVHGAGAVASTQDWMRRTALDQPTATGIATPNVPPTAAGGIASPGAPQRDQIVSALQNQQARPPVMAFDGSTAPAGGGNLPMAITNPNVRIPPAPVAQQAQIAPAPTAQQPQAGNIPAGYVMPERPEPKAPGILMPGPDEIALSQYVAAQSAANPYFAQGPDAQRLKMMQAAREYEQQRRTEAYKDELAAARAWNLERQKQMAGSAKNIADVAHVNAQADAARLIDPDGKMVMGTDGVMRPPRMEGVANTLPTAKLNEADKKTISFYGQMKLMEEQLKGKEEILAKGLQDEALGKVPFVGNALMRRQYRMAKNAAETWVDQYNIHQTGAASRDSEWERRLRNTMPRFGDDEAQIAQKRASREAIMNNLYMGLGSQSARAVADAAVKDNINRLQNTRNDLNSEMQSRFPDAKKGDTKTRIRNGKKETRVFDGKNWLESTDGD